MLSFTELANHYANSNGAVVIAAKQPATRRNTTLMAKSDAAYRGVMQCGGWMATSKIAAMLGKSDRAGIGVLRRLESEKKVQRREIKRPQGMPYCEWRWL